VNRGSNQNESISRKQKAQGDQKQHHRLSVDSSLNFIKHQKPSKTSKKPLKPSKTSIARNNSDLD
jgi:hypothetical protein